MYGLRQLGLVCLSAWLLSMSIDPVHGQTIDIDPFRIGLSNPASYATTYLVPPQLRGDTDGDGDLDFDDIPGFVALLTGSSLSVSAHSIPEPASTTLVAIAMAGVIVTG